MTLLEVTTKSAASSHAKSIYFNNENYDELAEKLFNNKKILMIEDEIELAEMYAVRFSEWGAEVKCVAEFDEALTYIMDLSNSIDLVITDICIINGTGIDLLRELKVLRPRLPAVVMTGSVAPNLELLFDLGAANVLEKPFVFEKLVIASLNALLPSQYKWKRSVPRAHYKNKILIEFNNKNYNVSIDNIGLGGMFIATEGEDFKVGDEISFDFNVEVEANRFVKITGRAVIRWIRFKQKEQLPPGIGVEFSFISKKSRRAILNIVNSKKSSTYIPISA